MKAFIKCPDKRLLDKFLEEKKQVSYTYSEVNGTTLQSIAGYDNDLSSILLGRGDLTWQKAKKTIQDWKQFPPGWTRIHNQKTPIEVNRIVAVLFKLFGVWWVNPAKIVYTIDEPDRFGFAYGTLEGHVEKGEECFWIERDTEGDIYYSIKAFSKPTFWGAKLAYPIARSYQRKFVKDSMAQMKKLTSDITT